MSALPRLNHGYAYREQVQQRAQGTSVLTHLARRYPHSSRSEWEERIGAGEVWLDGNPVLPHTVLKAGQLLIWQRPPWLEEAAPRQYQVVYTDDALLAVVKPSGLPTLPGGGFLENTLLSAVHDDYPEASPLHRLGRGTSGLVLFARTPQAAAALSSAWREHDVHKRYRALAAGAAAQAEYDISAAIGPVTHPRLGTVHAASASGKPSHSLARVLERRPDATLFQVDIFTGRPHQIRIHLASVGHPLLNDPLYGVGGTPLATLPGLPGDGGYWLHAADLRFVHPLSGEQMHLSAAPPPELQTAEERGN
ncbi:RluA family pseudouridine synthase [Deinococcus ruber]|uniref:Pseudouridine synthase n=1 Tax=Deinococcus ruber TaxID=1848197 RepID=A0A918BWQ6_9DEIO|nr:RluA family pseudouridine synthase [Deinococcus ruber]GGQ94408.1 RNA pseudouridine synthase [Deinococcus ruber]